jgi:predicted methyltransferase
MPHIIKIIIDIDNKIIDMSNKIIDKAKKKLFTNIFEDIKKNFIEIKNYFL